MVLSWLKDSDISGSDVTSQEMRCSVETSCTTADDTVFCVMVIEDDKSFPDEHFVLFYRHRIKMPHLNQVGQKISLEFFELHQAK
jgi:hypothetical protein